MKIITKRVVDGEDFTQTGQRVVWDAKIRGLGLLIGKRSKSFFLQRDVTIDGVRKSVRRTLGRTGEAGGITIEDARRAATDLIAALNKGIDPKEAARQAAGEAKRAREAGITLAAAWQLYQQAGEAKGRAPKTERRYAQIMRTYLGDWLDRPLRDISRNEVRVRHQQLAQEVAAGKHAQVFNRRKQRPENRTGLNTANDTFRLFRAIWNRARREQPELPENPCLNIDYFKIKPRREVIAKEQLRAWYEGVSKIPNPVRRDYLRFVLFTGLRRESASSMRWTDVDLDRRLLHIPKPKGGEERAFDIPLSDYLVTLLRERKAENDQLATEGMVPRESLSWVFPSWSASGHIEEPRESIPGVTYTIHDLRRTFITIAESLDISSYSIQALVNHRQPQGSVTAGYVVLNVERLRAPMQQITDYLLRVIDEPAEVIALPTATRAIARSK